MVKLTIEKMGEFNEYVLKEGKKQHSLALEFYGMPKPEIGDVLFLPREVLNTKSPNFVHSLYFEPVDENGTDNLEEKDIVGLQTKNKKIVLKRIYG